MGELLEMHATWYTTVRLFYEPAGQPGKQAELVWQGYDMLPERPAFNKFLAAFELGQVLRVQGLRGRLVNARSAPIQGASLTRQ